MFSFNSVAAKIIATCLISIFVATSLLTIVAWRTVESETTQTIDHRTRWSLRVAAEAFISYYPNYELVYDSEGEVARLVGPALPDFNDNDAVDRITRINRGTATIFRFDGEKNDFVRLTTSVKKADGTRAIGTTLGNTGVVFPVIMEGRVYRGIATILGFPYQTGYMPIADKDGKIKGILYIGVGKLSELRVATNELLWGLFIASVVLLVICCTYCALFLSRTLIRPMLTLTNITNDIANDRAGITIPYRERTDEFGVLARALGTLQNSMQERDTLRANEIESRNRDRALVRTREEAIAALRSSVGLITERMATGSASLEAAAHTLSSTVSQTADVARSAKSSAHQASSGIGMVASASGQLDSSIREVANRAEDSARIASNAVATGQTSKQGVSQLSAAAARIGEVVGSIRAIAEQTNLLALNATIEAARAGDAGRGFAVVATEVKALANQTGQATQEIAEQIAQIQNASTAVVAAFESILGALSEVDGAGASIAASVEQQGVATSEIARSAGQAADGAEAMTQMVLNVETMSASAAHSVNALENTAASFRKEADELVRTVDDFLKAVAA